MKVGISLPVSEMQKNLGAIRGFAQTAEGLGLAHLRVPDQIFRENGGHLHEPMMLLSYLAAVTETIELGPSVIILPARQTVLFAKQAADLDVLSNGRVRLGIGVGGSPEEYESLGEDFHTRGKRCDEQLDLLKLLWTTSIVHFHGRYHGTTRGSLDPLPVQRPIPVWIGGASVPSEPVLRRIGSRANGWFVLCSPDQFDSVKSRIDRYAIAANRDPAEISAEAGVAIVGSREAEWQQRVMRWEEKGLTHLSLRTLGGRLAVNEHIPRMQSVVAELPS